MVFYPLRWLRANLKTVKEDGVEKTIDWNDPFERVKYFYLYNSPDGAEVSSFSQHVVARPRAIVLMSCP